MIVPQAATIARTPPQPADDAPHLLLVEDDRVTTAMSASDARAKLLGLHFDLLILDVMMPGETGFDLARFIRSSSSVPIIMLTARHEAEARDRKSTRLNSSHGYISYAVFCLKTKMH